MKRKQIYTGLWASLLLLAPAVTSATSAHATDIQTGQQSVATSQLSASQSTSSQVASNQLVETSRQSQGMASRSQVTEVPAKTAQTTNEQPAKSAAKAVLNRDYQGALKRGAQQLVASQDTEVWSALALISSGAQLTTAQKATFHQVFAEELTGMAGHYSATDLERLTIGIAAIGEDPTQFNGINLIAEIIKKAATAGITGQVYGIIALSTQDYGSQANQTINQLIDLVLKQQNTAGGWAFFGSVSDLDITGMTMSALGMHRDQPKVQSALDRAVALLKTTGFVKATGGFLIPGGFSTEENSNSTAMAILGLAAAGVNPATTFIGDNGATPITNLIAYQKADGQFRWMMGSDDGALSMSTEQAVYALGQYDYLLKGKGSIYNFKKVVPEPDPEPKPDPKPAPAPKPSIPGKKPAGESSASSSSEVDLDKTLPKQPGYKEDGMPLTGTTATQDALPQTGHQSVWGSVLAGLFMLLGVAGYQIRRLKQR
ncbi:LPXTG cell wall anchor domain-containing protein [Latilactobacillus sakei]|uniref:LPXTG cell wall anchor domain-containing protein n=1 Tax=Latilactobacillus sakei TaxID=1599 RepID=UPI00203080BD|nr:LPXTG cell wall anchor domain-containing protein [Latilactobacillus sakei]MCM1598376.1 LPXTG cell wall anchor domain-containing protein [Latilactobacillus sakei]